MVKEQNACDDDERAAKRENERFFRDDDEDENDMNAIFNEILEQDEIPFLNVVGSADSVENKYERSGTKRFDDGMKRNPMLRYGVGIQNYL